MTRTTTAAVFALFSAVVCLGISVPGQADSQEKKSSKGWIDLFPSKDLKGWKRIPLGPEKKLSATSPWKVDAKNKVLICNGAGIWEMLLYQKPFKDGIFHVEWRFRKVKKGKKTDYNGGVYVRTSADGKEWLQAQVAMLDKAPKVADLFGDFLVKGKTERALQPGIGHKIANPVGKWNAYDVICKGKNVSVKLNGTIVTRMKNCPRLVGHVGLQSEFYYLEFKNLKWKTLD